MAVPRHMLPVIVLSPFAGTSLWFAANAAMGVLNGALVWGTALPHGLRALGVEVSGGDQVAQWFGLAQWQIVILSVSVLAT